MEDLVSRESIRKNIKQRLMETALNTCGEETTMDEACIDICDNRIDTWINEVSPISCNATTEEIAQSFIEDVEAVKEHLPCCCQMEFPATFEEYAKNYGLIDDKEIYTNGSHLIPVFRVKQWLDHIEQQPCDDCVSRQAVDQLCYRFLSHSAHEIAFYEHFCDLPSVTPTRKSGLHWIERFDNTDKWLECPHCHKDSDNAYNYCPNCGADMRGRE